MIGSKNSGGTGILSTILDCVVKLMNDASPKVVVTVSGGNTRISSFPFRITAPVSDIAGTLQSRSEYENAVKVDEVPLIDSVSKED